MSVAVESAREMQKAVRTVKRLLGGVVVSDLPRRRKGLAESRVSDVGVRVLCKCGRMFGAGLVACPRCGGDRQYGFLSW